MTRVLSRRALFATALALGSQAAGPLAANANTRSSLRAERLATQKKDTLAIAVLETHWEVLQPLAEAYADSVSLQLDATRLKLPELYSQLSIALTQRAASFDVVFLPDTWVPQFASFLSPLDLTSDIVDVIAPIGMQVSRFPADSQPRALPWLGEAQFFSMRADWLERSSQLPLSSWDDTVLAATTLAAELDPKGELSAFGIRSLTGSELVESFLPVLRGYGKELIDPETSVPQLETPEALAAMGTFLTLVALSPAESAATDAPNNAERFEAGQIAMMANFWSSDLLAARSFPVVPQFGSIESTLQPAQLGFARQAMTGIWLAGIPSGSLMPDAARAFLDWLIDAATQRSLPALSLPPVRVDVLSDSTLVDRFPDLPVLAAMLGQSTPRPRSPFYPQLEQLLTTDLQHAVTGEITGADALKNANVALRQFLVREGILTA